MGQQGCCDQNYIYTTSCHYLYVCLDGYAKHCSLFDLRLGVDVHFLLFCYDLERLQLHILFAALLGPDYERLILLVTAAALATKFNDSSLRACDTPHTQIQLSAVSVNC